MTAERWARLEKYVLGIMREENIAGCAIAISRHGEVLFAKGLGVRDVKTQEPVTANTIFGVASVTKSFTALAIMALAAEGKLSVHDPVIKHLPEFALPGVGHIGEIKIYHLLSHTTGIPPMRRRQELQTFAQHLEYLATEPLQLLGRPGEYISYCNDVFLLLGAIIERLTGQRYADYITNKIVKPLGMGRTTLYTDALASFDDVSTPYIYNRAEQRLEQQPWPRLGNYEVGGGVRSCVLDLLKYGDTYLSPVSLGIPMYIPVHPLGRNSFYGYALKITPHHAGVTLVEHSGGQPGVSANFGFVPERGLVVAVLANVTGVSAARIWLAAVNVTLGLPLEFSTAVEYPHDCSTVPTQQYVGVYSSQEGGRLSISQYNGCLMAETEGESFPLYYSGDDYFFFTYRGQKVIHFFSGADGIPWAAFLGLRILRREPYILN